jgi:hypothetical protein
MKASQQAATPTLSFMAMLARGISWLGLLCSSLFMV